MYVYLVGDVYVFMVTMICRYGYVYEFSDVVLYTIFYLWWLWYMDVYMCLVMWCWIRYFYPVFHNCYIFSIMLYTIFHSICSTVLYTFYNAVYSISLYIFHDAICYMLCTVFYLYIRQCYIFSVILYTIFHSIYSTHPFEFYNCKIHWIYIEWN